MADEEVLARFVRWCEQEKARAEKSLELMRSGALRVFHGAAHSDANDVTAEAIAHDERIVREMDEIIEAERVRRGG